jgi:glycosyltransferase involved in cell wall biosynthesis
MKIGIDIRNIGKQKTGSEVVVLELTKNILKLDNENKYFLLTDTDKKDVLRNIKKDLDLDSKSNTQIISLKAKNKFIWAAWSMPIFMRKKKLDIFHTEYIVPFFVSKNTKIITHIHDVSFKAYRKMILKRDLFFLDMLIPRSIRIADKIIAVSEFTKKEILKYYEVDDSKIEVVYNSINIKIPQESESRKAEIISKYNLPPSYILYLVTLQPRKNIAILIEAYAKIKDKIPNIKLVIAGNKKAHNFDKKIDKVISNNNLSQKDVVFCGYVDTPDKSLMYKMSEVFVFPSFYEGFGIPILEAITQGTPVIASDIPPHREVAKNSAIYFEPKDLDNLSKKLYNICVDKNLRNKLIDLGRVRINFFSWEKSAKKLLKIYKSLKK